MDFASTFLGTGGEFISIWSEVETLTWEEVQSAAPVFFTMGGILALAMFCAGLGWRFDRKVSKIAGVTRIGGVTVGFQRSRSRFKDDMV